MIENDLIFRPAVPDDVPAVLALYRGLAAREYSTWSDDYPALEHVAGDLAVHGLYCLCRGGVLAAAGTVRRWPEHDGVAEWTFKHPADLFRLGVAGEFQGRGLGALMLGRLIGEARRRGFDGLRLLVGENNLPALRLYEHAGAQCVGRWTGYGVTWLCCQIAYQIQ